MTRTLGCRGRGRNYSRIRGVVERVQGAIFVSDWPGRLWGLVPGATEVRTIPHSKTLPAGPGPGCRIVLLTDIHVGPTTPATLLDRAFGIARDADPDVLLLGGDYVYLDATPQKLTRLAALVRSIPAPTKLAVLGNHDLWAEDHLIVAALEEAGATVMINDAARLPAPWHDVAIVGLDDPWTGTCDAAKAFAQLGDEPFRIVLCHGPDGLGQLEGRAFDVYLCGHTHGGHIATPWGPIVLPNGAMCRLFPSGFGRHGGREVFVSRGIGGIELPIRTFASPDVLILDLVRPT